jgi:L,D-transpeptidase YcbB
VWPFSLRKSFILLLFATVIYSCGDGTVHQNISEAEKGQQSGENHDILGTTDIISNKMLAFYIKQTLDSAEKDIKSPHLNYKDRRIWKTTQKFYQKRNFEPIWEIHKGEQSLHEQFLAILDTIHYDGLNQQDYNLNEIRQLLQLNPEHGLDKAIHAAVSDVAITAAFIKLTRNIKYGRLNPKELRMRWHIYQEPQTRPDSLLKELMRSKDVQTVIENSQPKIQQYQKLRDLIKYYFSLKENPQWTNIPLGKSLAKGDNAERVGQLRNNLIAAGFLKDISDTVEINVFDDRLQEALKSYQRRFDIEPTGIAGPITINEINASIDEKLRRIKINLERLRWLPEDLGEKYIWVNVPEYWLKVIENGQPVLQMKIIAGRVLRQTPVFSDHIKFLVFAPYWNVPTSMAIIDILPKIQNNPNYLSRMRMEILEGWDPDARPLDPNSINWNSLSSDNFPYRIRQKPGPWNAMGSVKFMFPNNFQIYLHDTPSPNLFKRESRSFSSGCIRLEKPVELAKFLLPELSEDQIRAKMKKREEEYVNLKDSVPVHIVYFTTWINGNGTIINKKDVYKEDEKYFEAIAGDQ